MQPENRSLSDRSSQDPMGEVEHAWDLVNQARLERDHLRAGIQWVRGMCSDGEPLNDIDAKLCEVLSGETGYPATRKEP